MPRPPVRAHLSSRSSVLVRAAAVLLPAALLPVLAIGQSSADPVGSGPGVPPSASLFTPLKGFEVAKRDDGGRPAVALPTAYRAFRLDPDRARAVLAAAPAARSTAADDSAAGLELAIPDPSGALVRFALVEDSVMEPGLAAQHPEITTYAGRSLDGPARSIRLDVGTLGLHASVRSPGGGASWYVDPAYVETDATRYLSYYGAAVPETSGAFVERNGADTEKILADAPTAAPQATVGAGRPAANAVVTRRTYRMAFVTDPTYATYFGTANVLSAKIALLNRTNQVYNDDVAVTFVLIDGTDRLNLDTDAKASQPNGPCGASACYDVRTYRADPATAGSTPDGCTSELLTRNEFVLGQLVGADNFDIGHIGLGVNGGGIAGLGVVGGASKADGCTGVPTPEGDFYAIDYFSHEVGHQMGGNHTFNGTQVNCAGGNRNGATSVEPGSGSSVMAYAGICGQDNTQPHSDPYFSQRSIDEFDRTITATPSAVDEVQTVTLRGFGASGTSFQLGFPGKSPVTLTAGPTYNLATVTAAVLQLTGCAALVTNYDAAAPTPGNSGFTVSFNAPPCRGTDLKRLEVTGVGPVTGFVGVLANGGPAANGGTAVVTANHAPTVVAPADKTIPIRTPFTLSGTATDMDPGDNGRLIYLWEQNDAGGGDPLGVTGGTALVDNTKIDGPLFRVFGKYADVSAAGTVLTPSPGQNIADAATATRTFPDLDQVLADNTNAETGSCTAAPPVPTVTPSRSNVPIDDVECYAEFLPTADDGAPAVGLPSSGATIDFRLTARDLFPTGGGTQYDDVALRVDNTAGPFAVTSRPTTGSVAATAGALETVAWDVNGTNTAALAQNVKISISTDSGKTFTQVIASTPNDGSQAITLPNVTTTRARIKVEAVGNYFFDTNDADFTIKGPLTLTAPQSTSVQYSDVPAVTLTAFSPDADGDQLTVAPPTGGLSGLTAVRISATPDLQRPGVATFAMAGKALAVPGTYPLSATVSQPAPAATATAQFTVVVMPEDATVTYTGQRAVTATSATTAVQLATTVVDVADGSPGDIENATVTFVDRASGATLCTSPVTGGPTTGQAACTANLPSALTTTYTVATVVGGSYVRNEPADDTPVVVTGTPVPPTPTPTIPVTIPPTTASTPGPFAPVKTKTRIRLPQPVQVAGRKPVRLLFQVTAATGSGIDAGTVTVRVDGKRVRRTSAPVTLKQGRTVRGLSLKVPRSLRVGKHRFVVTFTPDDPASYTSSKSRTITLTVVRG